MELTATTTIRKPGADVYEFWRHWRTCPPSWRIWTRSAPPGTESHWRRQRAVRPGRRVGRRDHRRRARRADRLAVDREAPTCRTPARSGSCRPRTAGAPRCMWILELRHAGRHARRGRRQYFGEDPHQQLDDDLRRLKQVLETGEVVRSDGAPGGKRARKEFPQRPAQPLSDDELAKEAHGMKANIWAGPQQGRGPRRPGPEDPQQPRRDRQITSTAICGSDLHLVDGYVPTMQDGDIMGHEFMGEVVEVGPGVDPDQLRIGDRVVVPFPIACGACAACGAELYSCCENSNPNAGLAEKMFGHPVAGIFGYSHLTGGFAGGQAEYARVPFADVGPLKIESDLTDEQVLFLSDILPTGYMGAEMCDIQPSDVVAVWGAGPVGQFAMDSARVLGAAKVIAIDKEPYRLQMAEQAGLHDDQLRGGRRAVPAAGTDRRARPGQVHRRGRHGGHPRQRAHRRLRPGQAGRTVGDRTPARAAPGDPVAAAAAAWSR